MQPLINNLGVQDKKLKLDELGRMDVKSFKEGDKHPITVVLDNVRSAINVGSIFRTCDALAVERIILLGITPCPPHREILKSAIGATETVDWVHMESNEDLFEYCQERDLKIFSVEQTANSKGVEIFNNSFPMAVVFGNEVEGVQQEIIDKSYASVELPQYGTKHSFNVSVCAGIVLWEGVKSFISQKK